MSYHGNSVQKQVMTGVTTDDKENLEYLVECHSKADSQHELVLTGSVCVCGPYQSLYNG